MHQPQLNPDASAARGLPVPEQMAVLHQLLQAEVDERLITAPFTPLPNVACPAPSEVEAA
jgi:hypothetical protein